MCNNNIVEEEYHVILECNRYSDVRNIIDNIHPLLNLYNCYQLTT